MSAPLPSSRNTKMNNKWLVLVVEEIGEGGRKGFPQEMWLFLKGWAPWSAMETRTRAALRWYVWGSLDCPFPVTVRVMGHLFSHLYTWWPHCLPQVQRQNRWTLSSWREILFTTHVVLFDRHQKPSHLEITSQKPMSCNFHYYRFIPPDFQQETIWNVNNSANTY